MAQGEQLRGNDSCKIEKFEGNPKNLRKTGTHTSTQINNSNVMAQPKINQETPKFQGSVNI